MSDVAGSSQCITHNGHNGQPELAYYNDAIWTMTNIFIGTTLLFWWITDNICALSQWISSTVSYMKWYPSFQLDYSTTHSKPFYDSFLLGPTLTLLQQQCSHLSAEISLTKAPTRTFSAYIYPLLTNEQCFIGTVVATQLNIQAKTGTKKTYTIIHHTYPPFYHLIQQLKY